MKDPEEPKSEQGEGEEEHEDDETTPRLNTYSSSAVVTGKIGGEVTVKEEKEDPEKDTSVIGRGATVGMLLGKFLYMLVGRLGKYSEGCGCIVAENNGALVMLKYLNHEPPKIKNARVGVWGKLLGRIRLGAKENGGSRVVLEVLGFCVFGECRRR